MALSSFFVAKEPQQMTRAVRDVQNAHLFISASIKDEVIPKSDDGKHAQSAQSRIMRRINNSSFRPLPEHCESFLHRVQDPFRRARIVPSNMRIDAR